MLHVGNLAKIVAETLRAAGISQDAPLTIREFIILKSRNEGRRRREELGTMRETGRSHQENLNKEKVYRN